MKTVLLQEQTDVLRNDVRGELCRAFMKSLGRIETFAAVDSCTQNRSGHVPGLTGGETVCLSDN